MAWKAFQNGASPPFQTGSLLPDTPTPPTTASHLQAFALSTPSLQLHLIRHAWILPPDTKVDNFQTLHPKIL